MFGHNINMRDKRGVFFSADALIALAIILIVVLIAFPLFEYSSLRTRIHEDTLVVLSSLKIGEIDNAYVQGLIAQGKINDLNRPIIEQIGIFYAENKTLAKNLAQEILNGIDTNENIGIWYDNELLALKGITSYEDAE